MALRRHLKHGADHIRAAQTLLSTSTSGGQAFRVSTAELDQADRELVQAEAEVGAARSNLSHLSPGLAVARRLPGVGGTAAVLPPVTDFADNAARGARELVAGLRPLAQEREAPTPGQGASARFAAALVSGSPAITAAQRDLERAQSRRLAIREQEVLSPLRAALAPLSDWDREWPALDADLKLLVELPGVARLVLGVETPRSYAIVGQNSAELRPTGGFLGSMGIVQLAKGEIVAQDYRSIYAYDPDNAGLTRPLPAAPAPLSEHLGIAGWHIQDANWSPNFPTSAHDLRAFLAYDAGIKVDGVIAFDSYAVQELLRALGPVEVAIDGRPELFTAENWLARTTQLIYLDPEHPDASEGKGRVLAPLLQTVLARVNGVTGDQLTALVQGLRLAVAERHILFQFDDPAAQAFIYRYSADGSLRLAGDETVIYPVEANLSYTKIGPFILEQTSYELWLDEAGVCRRARIALTWQNTVAAEQIADPVNRIAGDEWDAASARLVKSPGVYGLYERVYVPAGAALTSAEGTQEPVGQSSDGNFGVFGTYVSVHAGQTRSLVIELVLPDRGARRGHFNLRIPKQPGTQDRGLDLVIHTASARTPHSNLALTPAGPETFRYQGTLNRDLSLELDVSP